MVESNAEEYDLVWTPEFAEEVLLAVEYVQNHLKMPMAARNLLKGIEDVLDARRTMPHQLAWNGAFEAHDTQFFLLMW